MAKTKRVQVLMEPREFERLEPIARNRGSTVAELMREAVRAQYLVDAERARRFRAAQMFLGQADVALPEWSSVKNEIAERRG